jgi:hypothetical protein
MTDSRFTWSGEATQPPPQPPPQPLTPVRPPAPVYSRWRGGSTSFGPVGRIVATVLVIGIGVGLLVGDLMSGAAWLLIAGPLALPSIWKRERIR